MEQLFCGKLHRQWRQVAPHPALRATFPRRGRLFEKRYIMSKLHLILPMAGRGSRFFKNGFVCPKPLIEINGKPFFYWAARSVEKFVDCADLTFVVLEEHIRDFAIDEKIKAYWHAARIVALPEVT